VLRLLAVLLLLLLRRVLLALLQLLNHYVYLYILLLTRAFREQHFRQGSAHSPRTRTRPHARNRTISRHASCPPYV
jgi:hypothetical protein